MALLVAGAGAALGGDDDDDHELAHRLTQEGRIRPLAEIVAAVQAKIPGEMIEVELDREDGAYVYELKILRSDGKIQEIEVDAATGRINKIEDDD
jgi:uncharacterized membrane protein YkoI